MLRTALRRSSRSAKERFGSNKANARIVRSGCGRIEMHIAQGWLEKPGIPADPANRFDLLGSGVVLVLFWLAYQVSDICGESALGLELKLR